MHNQVNGIPDEGKWCIRKARRTARMKGLTIRQAEQSKKAGLGSHAQEWHRSSSTMLQGIRIESNTGAAAQVLQRATHTL